jgi:phenylalanine-4-hydroxylase
MARGSSDSIYRVEQIARLPRHLKQYIVEQDYERYSPQDQAVWRYIMRQAFAFHQVHAHEAYVEGLRKTGIGLERIPRIEEMNEILGRIGWGAAPVDGFIPPAAFMEFQAHRVLVIAADIRQIDHLEYTPAPDIVHEAAGHAPIIADGEYAEYLRRFGEYGARALSSKQDFELYEAIRHLSILKEAPGTSPEEIAEAEKAVSEKQASLGEPSEMALLSRLHWWTVEYGLIGTLDRPRLYGAGLLSSIGEAAYCLTDEVKKLPYGVDAANYAFDITKMQPQLFVTSSFAHLNEVLEGFANTMAFRRGGLYSLERAIQSRNVATVQYSSGLQVSGVVTEVVTGPGDDPSYVRTAGPTALAVGDVQLEGQGKDYHRDGFGSPVGLVGGVDRPLETMTDGDLHHLGLETGKRSHVGFTSGVRVEGRLERVVREGGKVVLMRFSDCRVTDGDRLLFDPSWGPYDMAVGAAIVSVFNGAADKDAYDQVAFVPRERTVKVVFDEGDRHLHELYQAVRTIREQNAGFEKLTGIYRDLRAAHPEDWLLALETLEILKARRPDAVLQGQILQFLSEKSTQREYAKLITNGLSLLSAA